MSLPLRGCARRRVSERNRRRRLLARRLKLSPKVTDAGKVCHSIPLTGNRGKVTPHPTSGGASATFPQGGGGTDCRKRCAHPLAPLRGGSARRRWGRELYGCPKYFGLWQGSLPPPLRGTAPPLAQAPPPPYRGSLSRRGRSFDTLVRTMFAPTKELARRGRRRIGSECPARRAGRFCGPSGLRREKARARRRGGS